jgi:hypothetical protein
MEYGQAFNPNLWQMGLWYVIVLILESKATFQIQELEMLKISVIVVVWGYSQHQDSR